MGQGVKRGVQVLVLATFAMAALPARAAPSKTKVMVLTSTYGVLAGSLTGLASLAFYKSPGDHMRNVAIGASLGLYTGIGLGLYLIYFDPKSSPSAPVEEEEEDDESASSDAAAPELEPWQLSQRSLDEGRRWAPILGVGPGGQTEVGFSLLF